MDAVALAAVISSAAVGLVGAGVGFYSAHRAARTAQEGRVEQRSADGYLKVLSLAEQEAQWSDSCVYNLGLDRQELAWGVAEMLTVPKPEVTERATAGALIAAYASASVQRSHASWREAMDALVWKIDATNFEMMESADPRANVPDEWMTELTEDLQAKEHAARKTLAEAVALELGHRRPRRKWLFLRPRRPGPPRR